VDGGPPMEREAVLAATPGSSMGRGRVAVERCLWWGRPVR
jgi:hypothetical protein